MTSVKFNKTFLHMDVLCVKFYQNYILAGIGSDLFVYSRDNLILSEQIFPDERIHSIYTKNNIILVKGGRKLSLLKLNEIPRIEIISTIQLNDWIQDVIVLKNPLVGFVTAHNNFGIWDFEIGERLKDCSCEEKCILYSCKIIGEREENIVIFGGTVFGELLIWSPNLGDEILQRLKCHNGAIFSIDVKPKQKLLTTTSDDRSLKIWSTQSILHPEEWKNSPIQLLHTLFGHTARVWRNLILPKNYITIGEDSQLIVWSSDGRMIKTLNLHQESGIRALDYSFETNMIITGGEGGGINEFSLNYLFGGSKPVEVLSLEKNLSTKICFFSNGIVYTSNGNCIMVSDSGEEVIYKNENFASYCLLEVSPGGEYILLGSIKGHLVVINSNRVVLVEEQILNGRVYSIHCLNQFFLTCGPEGRLDLWELNEGVKNLATMTLPVCKERWTTCGGVSDGNLILGDRMGNIHVFTLEGGNLVKSFRKIHSYLGVTDVFVNEDTILTVGRDGSVKEFTNSLDHIATCKLPIEWPWKIVKYETDTLILGFHSVSFVVWSMKEREVIASHNCGGAHRSCDYKLIKNTLRFVYIKEKKIFSVDLLLNGITRIRNGLHGKEINSLKILQISPMVFITGSEDTTLRIIMEGKQTKVFKTHVSSIRDISIYSENNKVLISSGGGKGQICIWEFNVKTHKCQELINHRLRKENNDWKSLTPAIDPEMRIMCSDILKLKSGYLIAAGCSDCQIRIFSYDGVFEELCEISYTHCLLKVSFLEVGVMRLLVSMGTDGKVVFWDVKDYSNISQMEEFLLHQSGINSFHFEKIEENKFILATGGDDNMISVAFVEVREKVHLKKVWENKTTHSCQVTGIKILKKFLITTSIDQRITVWKWSWENNEFKAEFCKQYMTAVPDIQGMDGVWLDDFTVLLAVYGKGIEILKVELNI